MPRQSGEHRNELRYLNNFVDFNFAEVWITQPANSQSVVTINLSDTKCCYNYEKILKSRHQWRNIFYDKLPVRFRDL